MGGGKKGSNEKISRGVHKSDGSREQVVCVKKGMP